MKIFNWMIRRYTHKDGFNENVKKTHDPNDEILTKDCDSDTQALLENIALADMLCGWGGGILAIGTFGLDSLNHDEKEYKAMVKDEEKYEVDEYSAEAESESIHGEEEEEELNPLVYLTSEYGHRDEDSNCSCHLAAAQRANLGITVIDRNSKAPFCRTADDHAIDSSSNKWGYEKKMVNKKERTTLADLFSAESNGNTMPRYSKKHHPQSIKNKKPNSPPSDRATDGGHESFPKKKKKNLFAGVKENHSLPIRKLNQLMKKMLKRKIHPADSHIKSCSIGIPSSDDLGPNESVSLLQIQKVLQERCE